MLIFHSKMTTGLMTESRRDLRLFSLACFVLLFSLSAITSVSAAVPSNSVNYLSKVPTTPAGPYSPSLKYEFAFVSNFESLSLGPWHKVSGKSPSVVVSPNYSGEPVLKSTASSTSNQSDYATKGIEKSISYIWFQVAIDYSSLSSTSKGYFGLGSSGTDFVAVVGVQDGNVVAGGNLSTLQVIEPIPTGTAYPPGWVLISGWIMNDFDSSSTMRLFVDRSDVITANSVLIPNVDSYTGALITTTKGTVYYTNIVLQTIQDPSNDPGFTYSQMGYGEGSGGNIQYLPFFSNLTAQMTLYNWSVPQNNLLSFQMNAMNMSGAKASTCSGFFQLGVDFNKKGHIAPWYVNGTLGGECEAHYFDGFGGVSSPSPTNLVLSIVWDSASSQVVFKIVDETTSQTFEQTIPYLGGAFYAVNTQLEFDTAKNSPSDYKMQGSFFDFQITPVGSASPQYVNSTYMLPYFVNSPPTWDPTFFNNGIFGYNQIST